MSAIFSERLKQEMENKGFSQIELARATGLNKSAISQYLSGKYEPSMKSLKLITDTLNVSLNYLYEQLDQQPSEKKILAPEAENHLAILKGIGRKIKIADAAKIMWVRPSFLHVSLQHGKLPFGYAEKMPGSSKYSYYINPKQFYEYMRTEYKFSEKYVLPEDKIPARPPKK